MEENEFDMEGTFPQRECPPCTQAAALRLLCSESSMHLVHRGHVICSGCNWIKASVQTT